MGGVRANEDWTIRVDTGQYDAVLGDSYQSLARLGLSFQRSQTSGRFSPQPGPSLGYYKRLQSKVDAPAKEESFFDGIDTTLSGIPRLFGKSAPAGVEASLTAIDREIKAAVHAFTITDPSASAPALARALAAARSALAQKDLDPDVAYTLQVKRVQIADALNSALGISLSAMAQPAGTPEPAGPFGAGPSEMPPVVPGQAFEVRTAFTSRGPRSVRAVGLSLEAASNWRFARMPTAVADAAPNAPVVHTFSVAVPDDLELTRPYFWRQSIQDTRYSVRFNWGYRAHAPDALYAAVRYEIDGVPNELRRPVTRAEANLPYGHDIRVLAVLPAIGVTISPSSAVFPLGAASRTVTVKVEVLNNRAGDSEGAVRLNTPPGWKVTPASRSFRFARAGERELYTFDIGIPAEARTAAMKASQQRIEAVASSGGREYREGYEVIRQRDLETRYLYRAAVTTVRGIDVKTTPGLTVGYVMGIGDDVPSGLTQLGARVQLLGERDLATGDLSKFSAIITGTRAYAVREDLKTYNRRLLDYVRGGGNLIVLYNTQEYDPKVYAPHPGELPRTAEEVSEEDSPVEILSPEAPVLTTPNRITKADFDSWVEQRGSKFWASWDPQYSPVIATWDRGQTPQKGGWLHVKYGKGHYTYFAYAFHRQLPYGVPGAYRLLANLLALNSGS
jgi:hypothetical protein